MDGPHYTKGRAANLIEGLLACDDLPQNDAPTEHVALLAVVAPCRYRRTQSNTSVLYTRGEDAALDTAD